MKPRKFDYIRPDTVAEALDILAEHGAEARIMAGGQSLMAMLNLRLIEPSVIVDISRISELSNISDTGPVVEVGAAVTQAQLEGWPGLGSKLPFVARAIPWVGHFQTRNRGTVCGSVAHADPSSELPLSLALLQGEVVLTSKRGQRILRARDFQLGMLTTARRDDELVTAVRFPTGVGAKGAAFREVARRHGDFAIVSVGAVRLNDGAVRLAAGGLADAPKTIELPAAANDREIAERIEAFAWDLGGFEDIHASARYRRDLLRRMAPLLVREVA
jgi:2-furoyl-CoA dehydrogenase FAD binding subunit